MLDVTSRRAILLLIAVSSLLRLIAAASLGLGNDEAYHFLYAVHPDLSYYDHPPMLAWVEWVGLAAAGSLFSPIALRSGFILLAAGSTWLMWRIADRWYGPRAGFLASLALNLTGYYGLAAGTFALPDGPLLFFWLLTIDRLSLALRQPGRVFPWVSVGAAWGCALLSKYHAVFLPAGTVLFLLSHPPMRRWLRSPGPYLAVGLGMLVFSPVLIWNERNGWVSFLFQGGRALGGLLPRPDYLATALGAQAGYLFPWIWIPLLVLLARALRNWKNVARDEERLAVCLALVPFGVFTLVACFRPVLPHWGLIGLVPLFPALGQTWERQLERRPTATRRALSIAAAFPVIMLGLTVLEFRTACFQRAPGQGWGLFTAQRDPTGDLYGWDQVANRLQQLGVLDDPNTFLFTRTWFQSAHLAHATRMKRPVVCYNVEDPRGFAFWSRPADRVGQDGILLIIDDEYMTDAFHRRWFQSSTLLDDFTVERSGKPLRRVRAYRLRNQLAAFPFDFSPERAAARDIIRAGGHPMGPRRTARRPDEPGRRSG
ncbi:MAG: glycosyltransferase family 39 protein [Isosphaeraceae bacterium]